MEDEEIRRGKYRLEIWESNKGCRGCCRWHVQVGVKEVGYWYTLDYQERPVDYDTAKRDGMHALERAIELQLYPD